MSDWQRALAWLVALLRCGISVTGAALNILMMLRMGRAGEGVWLAADVVIGAMCAAWYAAAVARVFGGAGESKAVVIAETTMVTVGCMFLGTPFLLEDELAWGEKTLCERHLPSAEKTLILRSLKDIGVALIAFLYMLKVGYFSLGQYVVMSKLLAVMLEVVIYDTLMEEKTIYHAIV